MLKIQIIQGWQRGDSALAAEFCTGPHNRLLRRQHCSSLCSQSEGHEHVAILASALGHIFVGFLAVFGRRNIRPPHFASKVSYSASPQTFAIYSCTAPCSDAATAMLFGQKSRRIFFDFKHAARQNALSMGLEPVFPLATIGQERHVHFPGVLHFLNHDGFHAESSSCGTLKFNSSCTCKIILALMPSSSKRRSMRTIASLMMSAAVPWMGAFTALRSA